MKALRTILSLAIMLMSAVSFGQNGNDSISDIQDSLCCSDTTNQDIPLEVVEIQPEYPGGDQELYSFINQNFKFPQETLEAGKVSGRFVISFIVEKDGTITDIQVVRSFEEHFDKAMISIFEQMPKWKPGEHLGKVVRTKYTWGISYDYKG